MSTLFLSSLFQSLKKCDVWNNINLATCIILMPHHSAHSMATQCNTVIKAAVGKFCKQTFYIFVKTVIMS